TIEDELAVGHSFVDDHATISGRVDLVGSPGTSRAERVRGLFVCNSCVFEGNVKADRAVFERGIDLTGSTINGSLNLHGAQFREPALLGGVRQVGAHRFVDLAFTKFDDLAVFRGATFAAGTTFSSAQFRSVARFGNVGFGRAADFEDAIFSDDALFSG